MTKFHGRWVTGFILIFLDINILIDLLPDFIGWMLIGAAFSEGKGEAAAWGKWSAIVASVLSMPLVLQGFSTLPQGSDIPMWLQIIYFALPFAEFLAYAAFFIVSDQLLERQKRSRFSIIILGYLLIWILWQHVNMHFVLEDAEITTLFLGLTGIVLMFCFFINIIVRHKEWKRKQLDSRLMTEITES
ncbi:hypothetical protein [Lysinibacillus odysseyi]|uniref:Uncharacterized protein n=1 Tax=Lysinibacillus odysseyi 34hs-1 = NBRC 100172 TaxID=1220589 RepID=A0A0A3JBH2_9BACI|nr:hypothetical protein [Lysinibacillus odysseyi]KGR84362.1 hypothetical protein CD32_12265 [Lysinibacillus odysseyi 34hs-1 = NBRC 100172]